MTANPENKPKPAKPKPRTLGKIFLGLVIAACAGGGGYFFYQQKAQAQGGEAPEVVTREERVSVVTTPVTMRHFERSLLVQGNVEAKHFAMVGPRIPGTIEAIDVEEGDPVIAGQTKLFETDAVALEKNVQINRHNLTVAQCARREAERRPTALSESTL